MKKVLCAFGVVLAMAVVASAARATIAYVPVLDLRADDGARIATQVSVDNYGEVQHAFSLGQAGATTALLRTAAALRGVDPAS
ncbi:MAG: hypothetical protein ACM3OB_05960, partial [Acidobacteriota bacterium]